MSAQWMTFLQAVHAVSAGTRDALFGRDIGFYLFKLPAIEAVLDGLIGLTLFTLGIVAVLFVLRGALAFLPPRRVTVVEPRAARQVGSLLASVFVLIALRLWIVGAASLLSSTTGPLVGASYTDVHVQLPAVKLSAIIALIAAGLVVYGTVHRPAGALRPHRHRAARRRRARRARTAPGRGAEAERHPQRAGAGDAVPATPPRGDSRRVGARQRHDA